MLYRRGYYVLALDIAKTQQMGQESVADIHRQYGDYLYAKPDYDAAMQQYLQTIGYVQPSYVIRKVLLLLNLLGPRITNWCLVFRCPTYPQSRHLSPGTALARCCQLGPHDTLAQHLHQAQGRHAARQLHQN
jgi:hypothetical protein